MQNGNNVKNLIFITNTTRTDKNMFKEIFFNSLGCRDKNKSVNLDSDCRFNCTKCQLEDFPIPEDNQL